MVPLRDFLVSPGFVGVAAVVAALVVLGAVLFAIRRAGKRHSQELEQRERHHQESHAAEQQAKSSAQCWQTFTWLVDTAGVEPAASAGATLGLGPELAMATLRGLLRDAERLGDETLADAVAAYQNQFALVLAQQGGPLSGLATSPLPPPAKRNPQPQAPGTEQPQPRAAQDKPDTKPVAEDNPTSAAEMVGDGRRRRR